MRKKINNYRSRMSVCLISHISGNNIIDCSNSLNACIKVLLFSFPFFFSFSSVVHLPVGFYCTVRIISTKFEEKTTLPEEMGKKNRPSFVLILYVLSFLVFFFLAFFSFILTDRTNRICSFSCRHHLS